MWASQSRDEKEKEMDIEGMYRKELRLEQVQIILRHGERSPIRPLFGQWQGLDTEWRLCNSAHHLISVIRTGSGKWDRITWRRRLESFGRGDDASSKRHESRGICQDGELTDKGRLTSLLFGKRLRSLYVDKLGFLPKVLTDAETIYVRTSPIGRTLESIHQALAGLYPPGTTSGTQPLPIIHVRALENDDLRGNRSECPRLREIMSAFVERTGARWNHSPEMDYINFKLQRHLLPSQRIKVESGPRLGTVMDSVRASMAHYPDIKLPSEFLDPALRRVADVIIREEWFEGFSESHECRVLGIGSLAGDIVSNMTQLVDANLGIQTTQTPAKFVLFGAHQNTIGAMLISLSCFDDTWPPFTSHVDIELFRGEGAIPVRTRTWRSRLDGIGRRPFKELDEEEKRRLDGYYIRVKYNDRVLKVPGCAGHGKHLHGDETFCTLAAFKSLVDQFTPRDWRQACNSNLGSAPIPAGKELP